MSAADVADPKSSHAQCTRAAEAKPQEESLGELRGKFANCVLMVYIFGGHDLNVAAEYFAQKQLFAGSQIEERLRAVERVYLDAVAKALRGSVRRQRKWLRSTWTSIFYLLIQYIYIYKYLNTYKYIFFYTYIFFLYL